ncbi:MAG: hypothetical protein WC455_21890 [Dehalococcoidia bacterium]|jgi:hypothetical protein
MENRYNVIVDLGYGEKTTLHRNLSERMVRGLGFELPPERQMVEKAPAGESEDPERELAEPINEGTTIDLESGTVRMSRARDLSDDERGPINEGIVIDYEKGTVRRV